MYTNIVHHFTIEAEDSGGEEEGGEEKEKRGDEERLHVAQMEKPKKDDLALVSLLFSLSFLFQSKPWLDLAQFFLWNVVEGERAGREHAAREDRRLRRTKGERSFGSKLCACFVVRSLAL